MTERIKPYPLRLEPDLLSWIKSKAEQGDRSINAQINRLIRQAKEQQKKLGEQAWQQR